MKKVRLLLRFFGFFILLIGVVLNVKMYIFEEWPTYLFYWISLFGVLLIGLSFFKVRQVNRQ